MHVLVVEMGAAPCDDGWRVEREWSTVERGERSGWLPLARVIWLPM